MPGQAHRENNFRPSWWGGLLICLLLVVAGAGCRAPAGPLPTMAATVPVPEVAAAIARTPHTVPATFTPIPEHTETPRPTNTPTPTLTPTATLSPTVTPTRNVIPNFLIAPVDAPYLETPPATVDCGEEGFVFRSRFPSSFYGPTRPYHVYLPPCYGYDGRTYPVLYLIHGSVQTDSHWLDLGLARHADAGIAEGRYPPFIAIMPYSDDLGNLSSGGDKSIEGITVGSLLPYIDTTYCAWGEAAGRSIGGISRGGYWALMIAFLHPDKFGAVSGHSSHLRYETDPAQYNPLSTYAAADLSALRIWLDWGERDFLRPGQIQLHEALTEAGIEHVAAVNTGSHNDRYWQIHLVEYLDWHAAGWPQNREEYPLCGLLD